MTTRYIEKKAEPTRATMTYTDLPMGELVKMRSQVTDDIRDLWSQHAKLKRERAMIDDAIEKLLQDGKEQPTEASE